LTVHRGTEDPWWRDRDKLQTEYAEHETFEKIETAHGVSVKTLRMWWRKHGLPPVQIGGRALPAPVSPEAEQDSWLLALLKKYGDSATVTDLADAADVSPRRVRDALERLGRGGFRVSEDEQKVVLERVAPDKQNIHPGLLAGSELRLGVVSDTHLGSQEEALAELHLAYDHFAAEGVSQVLHAGDWLTGRGIFRGQDSEIKVHTLDAQIDYLVEHYPHREGITTLGIGGNHDLDGEAGRVGLDPVAAFAHRREDITYLGPYSAWLQVGGEEGPWIHLLHGSGGMAYSYSYKAQKLVDGYPGGRKPAVLVVGHWHVRGNIEARGVEVLWPGCFEWASKFLERKGLTPAVGFHVLDLTFGDDGSVVQFLARWFRFWEGRIVG